MWCSACEKLLPTPVTMSPPHHRREGDGTAGGALHARLKVGVEGSPLLIFYGAALNGEMGEERASRMPCANHQGRIVDWDTVVRARITIDRVRHGRTVCGMGFAAYYLFG